MHVCRGPRGDGQHQDYVMPHAPRRAHPRQEHEDCDQPSSISSSCFAVSPAAPVAPFVFTLWATSVSGRIMLGMLSLMEYSILQLGHRREPSTTTTCTQSGGYVGVHVLHEQTHSHSVGPQESVRVRGSDGKEWVVGVGAKRERHIVHTDLL